MLNTICLEEYGKDLHLCSNEECFHALMKLVAQKGRDRIVKDNGRKVYYISAEFLIGKLLEEGVECSNIQECWNCIYKFG